MDFAFLFCVGIFAQSLKLYQLTEDNMKIRSYEEGAASRQRYFDYLDSLAKQKSLAEEKKYKQTLENIKHQAEEWEKQIKSESAPCIDNLSIVCITAGVIIAIAIICLGLNRKRNKRMN